MYWNRVFCFYLYPFYIGTVLNHSCSCRLPWKHRLGGWRCCRHCNMVLIFFGYCYFTICDASDDSIVQQNNHVEHRAMSFAPNWCIIGSLVFLSKLVWSLTCDFSSQKDGVCWKQSNLVSCSTLAFCFKSPYACDDSIVQQNNHVEFRAMSFAPIWCNDLQYNVTSLWFFG